VEGGVEADDARVVDGAEDGEGVLLDDGVLGHLVLEELGLVEDLDRVALAGGGVHGLDDGGPGAAAELVAEVEVVRGRHGVLGD
jgi:hypothetical protein